jgi:putative redox protein
MGYITKVTHKEDLAFDVELNGHNFGIDADEEYGGKNYGPRPKHLLLSGLAGCTGMDVASILGKMQVPFDSFNLEVDAESTDEHPKVYKKIHIKYIFSGKELDEDKINKAIDLSLEKYCGVHAMLGKVSDITHEVILNP